MYATRASCLLAARVASQEEVGLARHFFLNLKIYRMSWMVRDPLTVEQLRFQLSREQHRPLLCTWYTGDVMD